MNYFKITTAALALTMTLAIGNTAEAQSMSKKEKTVMVGGAAMYPSKNIVENAGGKIWFETSQNIGTGFFVSLPVHNP